MPINRSKLSKGRGLCMTLLEIIECSIRGLENYYISEAHLIADFYTSLILAGVDKRNIFLEYPYDFNKSCKCDIMIKTKTETETNFWIEAKSYLKTETPATRSRKHTHPQYTPFQSIDKLSKVSTEGNHRILIIYQNIEYEPVGINSWVNIENKCKEYSIGYRSIKKL